NSTQIQPLVDTMNTLSHLNHTLTGTSTKSMEWTSMTDLACGNLQAHALLRTITSINNDLKMLLPRQSLSTTRHNRPPTTPTTCIAMSHTSILLPISKVN